MRKPKSTFGSTIEMSIQSPAMLQHIRIVGIQLETQCSDSIFSTFKDVIFRLQVQHHVTGRSWQVLRSYEEIKKLNKRLCRCDDKLKTKFPSKSTLLKEEKEWMLKSFKSILHKILRGAAMHIASNGKPCTPCCSILRGFFGSRFVSQPKHRTIYASPSLIFDPAKRRSATFSAPKYFCRLRTIDECDDEDSQHFLYRKTI